MPAQKKVLIIDDDQGILDALSAMLEFSGYTPITSSGENVLSDIEKHSPDVILLDVHMKGIDGSEECKKIKRNAAFKHIPVIMSSANSRTQEIAQNAGADAYLEKPFNIEEMVSLINRFSA